MSGKIDIKVDSEIGKLNGVIIHTPGKEVENMTPQNAQKALYSDILNPDIILNEYSKFSKALSCVTNTFEVKDLLEEVLRNEKVKQGLIKRVCKNEDVVFLEDALHKLQSKELAKSLIEGLPLKKNNLTKYLSKKFHALRPLHNFFYTRDASVVCNNNVLISKMANKVREREAIIMETIFDYHPSFTAGTLNFYKDVDVTDGYSIEGGDVLIARDDIVIIGISSRTTSQGIDKIIEHIKKTNPKGERRHVIAQELPYSPESFIHLDMVFTLLDKDACMVYAPLILKSNRYLALHVEIEGNKVISIQEEKSIPDVLKKLGIDLKPLYCGGRAGSYIQEREQWHSGANFFAFAPGKVFGYERNRNTIEELNKNGFEVITADELINGKKKVEDYSRCVVTIEGSELSRGGGGCRCMTMPISREELKI